MTEDRKRAKRSSLPRIDTTSASASLWLPESGTEAVDSSKRQAQGRPHTLEDRILNSVVSSLSLSPIRPRDSLSSAQDTAHSPPGSTILTEDVPIKSKMVSEYKTLADVETEFVDVEDGNDGPAMEEQLDEHDFKQEDGGRHSDLRPASDMVAPEEIHRADPKDSTLSKIGAQDFDKHVHTPSMDSITPTPTKTLDTPSEVESFLDSAKSVSKVIILKPRAGLFDGKLVACLTFNSIPPRVPASPKIELIPPAQLFFAGTQIATIKQSLEKSRIVDSKVIPEVWIPLHAMPVLPESGDIDRRKIRTWVQNANQDVYERVVSLATGQSIQQPSTEMEKEVQKLVARTLQIPPEQVGMNFTFTQLGGDEATAMALVTNSRAESMFLESHDILESNNTLSHLAELAWQRGGLAHKWTSERANHPAVSDAKLASAGFFDLSPMQQLYFQTSMGGDSTFRASTDGSYRFNLSLLLRVGKGFNLQDISAATDTVVGHHDMLRARFANVGGHWMQRVEPEVEGSYSFMCYTISTNEQIESIVHNTQISINVESGPVFAVAHFQTTDGHQMLYLSAHHLVVDVASWKLIIQDLDQLLQHGSLLTQRAMPFRKWTEIQKLDAQMPSGGMPFDICPGDLEYWGLQDLPNTYTDASEASFSLSEDSTSLLETTCNQVLGTDSVDIYISALLLSFAQTFPDRRVPDVWNQEHGRDLWSNEINISQTVGWFTILCPLNQETKAESNFIDVLRRLKDIRRSIPHRGSHYFASKFLSSNNRSVDSGHSRPKSPEFLQIATRDWPIEILFSFAGSLQDLGKDPLNGNGVLEQISLPGRTLDTRTSDIGQKVGRIALFEINTTIHHGSAKIKFLYNRHSLHADKVTAWIQNYERLLHEAISHLRVHDPELTLADIPQLWATGMTYEGLHALNRTIVTDLGLDSVRDIEAVYPVTPVQQSILVSQARQLQFPAGCRGHGDEKTIPFIPNLNQSGKTNGYHIHAIYEMTSPDGVHVDLERVCAVWTQIVARYAPLRTVFIESVAKEGLFNAIVLRRSSPNMLFLDATSSEDPLETLNNLPPLTAYPALKNIPRHRLTVCQSPMKTVLKLDVSSALCDMPSVNGLIADLRRGYLTGRVQPAAGGDTAVFSHAGYLDFLHGLDRERSISWWRKSLTGLAQPCLFPKLDFYYAGGNSSDQNSPKKNASVHVEIHDVALQSVADFARAHRTTTGTVLRLAWGLVLRAVIGTNAICFGYKAHGRSATLEGMRSAIGSFANTIPVAFDLSPFKPLDIVLRQIEDGYNSALPYQHITLAEVRHAIAAADKDACVDAKLFNTSLAFTEENPDLNSRFTTRTNCELRNVMNHETTDDDITINTRFSPGNGKLIVDLGYSILSESQAHNFANTFGRAISAIVNCTSASTHIGTLDLFSDRDYAQIIDWTNALGQEAQQQQTLLHEVVAAENITRNESTAVCAHDGDLSYMQIEQYSHRLAHILVQAGVASQGNGKAAVPVILEKSKWAPIALLAVLKAGAAFVPVDADEMGLVSKIAEQLGAGSKVAIACKSAAEALVKATENNMHPLPLFDRVISLDDALMRRLDKESPRPDQLLPSSNPEDVACVFFAPTSSRSVRGISFTHTALVTAFRAQGPVAGINHTSRVLQLSSFNVDVSLAEVFTTLIHGGVLCIPTSRDRYNDYTGCVSRFDVNWSYMTPLLSRKLNVELLPTLKTVCFRTRSLDEDTYAPWKGRKRVVMAYGAPDVCPLGISFMEVHESHHLKAIGKPIAGSAWIVSGEDHRNLMPVGAVGEMVIEGSTLGKTFRPNSLSGEGNDPRGFIDETPVSPESRAPFSAMNATTHQRGSSSSTVITEGQGQGKKRYYKTGHSVRYIEGGLMEYVASKRDDLEINGRVVKLAELEQLIRRALGQGIDLVVEALPFKAERGQSPTLAAFLELGSDDVPTLSHGLDLMSLGDDAKQRVYVVKQLVEKALSGVVPEFVIPKIFIPVRHLPTTYSLKVNRRKLHKIIKGLSKEQLLSLAMAGKAQAVQNENVLRPLPMSEAQMKIVAIWARVLEIEESSIKAKDGFISLGGDEISATDVVVQCRKENMAISIADLMRNVSLADICRCIDCYGTPSSRTIAMAEDINVSEKTLEDDIEYTQKSQAQQVQSGIIVPNAPAPQVIDKPFIEETLAPKMSLDPSRIQDVVEATSTQIRHVETAMLAQSQQRVASTSPQELGLANVTYFVFHFTAASSTSTVSARRIEELCQTLATVHPILRTAFIPHVEGQTRKLYQIVLKNPKVDFKSIQRVQTWRLNATVDKEIRKDREKLLNTPNLFTRPITRCIFLDAGKTSTLIMRLSKAQYDDMSIGLLVKDLKRLYDGGQKPPRRPGFADFVCEAALSNAGGEAERYWRELLQGSSPTQVVRHIKPPKLSSSVRTLRETVSVNTTSMGGLGIGFDTVLKSAWGIVLASISGTPDVVFGEVVEGCHSRLQHHLGPSSVNRGGVLGPTWNILPVRIPFADAPTSPLCLLKYVSDQRSAGVPYENMGMLDIVERCTPWPYWTRLSTVVQHRTDPDPLADGPARSFRTGSTLCKLSVIESELVDIPDLLVRSFVKNKAGHSMAANAVAEKPEMHQPGGSWRENEDDLEISVSFCDQRVPANLVQEALNKVCGYIRLLTGLSMLQSIVPTAAWFAAQAKVVPISTSTFASNSGSAPGNIGFSSPFNGGTIKANFAQLEAKMSADQRTTIQSIIEEAWRNTLDPRTLGVPEEDVTFAAFYDLWGSLLPAASIADYLTAMIPAQMVGDLSVNLFAGNLDGFIITTEDIVDHPTMLGQFELIIRKAFGGEGRDRSGSVRSHSNYPLPQVVTKSCGLTNLASNNVRAPTSQTNNMGDLNRAGTVMTHIPSMLGHSRSRSDSTEITMTTNPSSFGDSPAAVSTPMFPTHPAVAPLQQHAHTLAQRSATMDLQQGTQPSAINHVRKGSGASITTQTTGTTFTAPRSVVTASTSASNTPHTAITSPDLTELPGSAVPPNIRRSSSIFTAEGGLESPVLGTENLTASPPVVQAGFMAARRKSNFGFGSSLRRLASNALKNNHNPSVSSSLRSPPSSPGLPFNAHNAGHKSSGSDKSGNEGKDTIAPVSPWVRVQSMAPQLPPFPPFTFVTEDAFSSLNGSAYTSSEGWSTGASPEMPQGQNSGGTSSELVFQQTNGSQGNLPVKVDKHSSTSRKLAGVLGVDVNGMASQAGPHESRYPEDEFEDEDTLRPDQVQRFAYGNDVQLPLSLPLQQQQQLKQPDEQQEDSYTLRRRLAPQHQSPQPSPVTETFYMEDDEDSEPEEDLDHLQYDPYADLGKPCGTDGTELPAPSQTKDDPVVGVTFGGAGSDDDHASVRELPGDDAPHGKNNSTTAATTQEQKPPTAGTHVQDFAAIEAAELADMVSPLTPVQQAMLYKQQGTINTTTTTTILHRNSGRLTGGVGR